MFDTIVVGSGPAGSVLATRIATETGESVCLLERGPKSWNPWLSVPLGYVMTLQSPSLIKFHKTKGSANLNNRTELWPRGNLLGGSTSINAGVYVRPAHRDLTDWDKLCGSQFSRQYDEIFPLIEGSTGRPYSLSLFNPEDSHHSSCEFFYQACEGIGLTRNSTMFNPEIGFGPYWISSKNGWRVNSVSGYLNNAKGKLSIRTGLEVTRLQRKENRWAVQCASLRSAEELLAGRVILCAGSLETPVILVNSGIGPKDELEKIGIPVQVDSPQVGKNLKDHLCGSIKLRSIFPTLNQVLPHRRTQISAALEFLVSGRGLLSTGINQAGAFLPDTTDTVGFQLYFNPLSHTSSDVNGRVFFRPDRDSGVSLSYSQCKPRSSGRLDFERSNGIVVPSIFPDFLSNGADIAEWKVAHEHLRHLIDRLQALGCTLDNASDGIFKTELAFLEHVRQDAGSVYHPCGTCRMAAGIVEGVVDTDFSVFGAENLYVCDASVFPDIPVANIQSSVFFLGEVLSNRLIKGAV